MTSRKINYTPAEESLFGPEGFLQFTLSNKKATPDNSVTLANGVTVEQWDTGVLHFKPKENHETQNNLVISAGVHGNETAPIEIVESLVSEIFNGVLEVNNNLLVILANPIAMNIGKRFSVENMNRLFKNNLVIDNCFNNYERKRAKKLMKFTKRFLELNTGERIHLDLHTAIRGSQYPKFAMSPNDPGDIKLKDQIKFLQDCGIEAILNSSKNSSTFSAYTSREFSATSFTIELGKARPFGDNDMNDFQDAISSLRSIISDGDSSTNEESDKFPEVKIFNVSEEIVKRTGDFKLCFDDNIENFTEFQPGQLLAEDHNYTYQVKSQGERILFPNAGVAIGQRALVIIKPV